jgi:hypothetical protein
MSTVLDVAIGLVFIYALASLVITALTEFLSTLFRFRGRLLSDGITQLLRDPAIAKEFYSHPMITVLSQPSPLTITRRPSEIPAKTFALVLADILGKDANAAPDIARLKTTFAGADQARVAQFQKILSILWESTGKIPEFHVALERMFNDTMDRVSGWYKRRADRVVFTLGIILTLLLNIDTIGIARTLWREPAVRAALVAEAEAYSAEQAKRDVAAIDSTVETPKGPPPTPPDAQGKEITLKDLEASAGQVRSAMDQLRSLSFPIGWAWSESDPQGRARLETLDQALETPGRHVLGWAATAFALSLGAPFWFDMLSKLISIRNAGKSTGKKSAGKN